MSKVEQGTGKAVAAKKNKVDADLLDPGSETPIERMDIVLPGAEEIGAPATHANEQPLDASVKTSSPAQTNDGNQNPENTESSSFGDTDPSAVNAPTSNSVGQTGSIRIDNAPPLDGADAASNDDGVDAPLAPESNLADAQSNTSANNQQQISSSSPTSPTGTGEGEEINVAPVDIAISNDEIAENASGGTVIATLSTVDGNVNDQHTYAIINDPSGFFEIVGDEIRVKEGADLDFEVSPVHELTIEVTDSAGNTFSEVMTINLTDVNEHDVSSISDTNGATNEISEDASDGDSVGLVASAFDADGTNNSVTYSLSDDAGGIFTIDEDTGEVTIANASGIDYENATSHTIEVTATSADGSTSTQNFTIDITDIDEHDVGAISDTDGSANTIAENVSHGDSVGITASATDADGSNNTVTYSLSDDAGGIFTIDANTGEVSIADASGIDYETATSHTIEVTATSEDGSTSTQSYAINVSDVDEFDVSAVSDNDGASNAVDEDASVGDTVGITALATDGDATNSDVTYSLSDDAGGLFDIDPNTGVVTVAGSLDAETDTSHTIEVTATSDDGSTSTQTFSIGVNDVNETSITAISDTDGSGNSVTEGASVGTAVGITAFASDADATDTVSYSLSSNPGDFFAIDANTGEVTVASALDYETDTSHTIEVTATSSDGTTSTQTFTIAVDDEDEHDVGAISDTDGSANTIAENVSNGDSVGITASATDADGSNNTVTYALSDDASGIFTIDANTGEVSIADASSIDYETATSHTIEVTATSEDGSTSTQSYTINVSDVDEFDVTAITDTDATANSVDENASVGDTVGITALATDGDATDSVTYSLSDDAGGLFDIDPNTGVVTVAGSLDAETDTSHTIEVTATSDDGSTSTQTFSIGVNDVNETSITAISDTDGSGNSVTEGASVGTAVGITAFASDADETDTISYSLSSNPGGFFAMRRSDDGSTSTQTFSIGVNDVNETSITAISDTDGTGNSVSEGASVGTAVGITAFASDADATDTVSYSLSSNPGGFFAIDANTGEVTVAGSLDYETDTSHTIEVTATSDDGSTSTQTFTIAVGDEDEHDVGAISDTDGSANTIAENVSNGDSVGITASATDADGSNNTVTYALSDDAGGIFTIDANTGEVSIADASGIDYESATSHTIEVTATSEDGSTSTQSYTINVSDVDEFDVSAISDTDTSANTIAENASAGDDVGVTASASDADATNSNVTYSVDDARFEVAADGTVTVASGASFDAETEGSIDIEVTATSEVGSTSSETFTINVSDIDEFNVGSISDSNTATNAVDEDASVGDTVGITALASDGDATDNVTYSLSDDAGGLFDIDASTGVVTVAGSLDAETDTSHTIEVTATSDDGSTSTQTFSIGVNDINETSITAISDTDGTGNSVTEGASVGTAVGITAFASDADATDTVSYSLSSNPGGFFAIDANTGEVTVAGALDYETDTSHTIEVTATSSDGTTSTQSFTIAVGDEDEHDVGAISDTDGSANTIAENVSNGDSVGITVSATDADGSNNTVTYSLSDDAGGIFTIDGSTGEVSIADASGIDYETATSHTIEVTATSADGSTSTQSYTINVTDINEGPTGISVGGISHSEDFEGGASGWSNNTTTDGGTFSEFLGRFGAEDGSEGAEKTFSTPDAASKTVFTMDVYEIDSWDGHGGGGTTAGAESLVIEVAGETIEIPLDKSWSNESSTGTSGSVSWSFTTTDTNSNKEFGGWNDQSHKLVIEVSDPEDAVTFKISSTLDQSIADESFGIDNFEVASYDADGNVLVSVNEDASAGTVVANLSAEDVDIGDSFTYTITNDPSGFFEISGDQILVKAGAALDTENAPSHDITVEVTDGNGNTYSETITINVADVDEFDISAVSDNDGATNAVDEDASVGDTVGITALASDGDATNSDVTYSLSDDAGGLFDIDASTGVVTVAGSLDAETDTSHTIEVTATSDDGSTSTQTFSIGVNDVNETSITAISDTDGTGNSVTEGASIGTAVGITAFASDADATDTVSYSLSSNPGGFFAIDANTGEVTVAAALDYETDTSHTIEVTATSIDGSTSTQNFTIDITDIDETIFIENSGFESQGLSDNDWETPVDGWTINNGTYSGVYDPRSSYASGISDENVAYLYEAGASLEQTLNDYTYSSDEKMIFSVDIGIPSYSTEQEYKLEIVVDGTVVGTHTGSTGDSNTLQTATVESSVFDPSLDGQDVTFRVVKLNENTEELYIDNVQAHFVPWSEQSEDTSGSVELLKLNDTETDGVASVSNLFSADLDEISYEVNLTVDNIPSGGATIVSYATMDGSASHDNEFTIMLNSDGSLRIIINQTSNVNTGPLATDLTDGSEHRLSVTWDNTDGSVKVYVDGTEEFSATGVAKNNMIDGGGTLTLGQEQNSISGSFGVNQIFSGTMDDIRIFNDVRTATEIADNHDSQLADPSSTSNLVANWQFDGESGTTVADLANQYDLTLSGDASLEEGTVAGVTLTGDSANNTLTGGAGNDVLDGLSGKDTLDGGAGDDILMAGFDDGTGDIFIGGEGNDTYQIEGSTVENYRFNVDLNTGTDQYNHSYSGIENINGGNGNDTFTGDANANIFSGGAGNDTMYGGDESDIFVFGEGDGADTVHGGSGGGWTDTIELTDAGGDLGTYGTDWTVSLTSGSIDAQDANSLTLSDDADGTITLADGSTVDFHEIERIEF